VDVISEEFQWRGMALHPFYSAAEVQFCGQTSLFRQVQTN
jgi:hypothetical protein